MIINNLRLETAGGGDQVLPKVLPRPPLSTFREQRLITLPWTPKQGWIGSVLIRSCPNLKSAKRAQFRAPPANPQPFMVPTSRSDNYGICGALSAVNEDYSASPFARHLAFFTRLQLSSFKLGNYPKFAKL